MLVSGKVFNDVEVIPGIEDFQVELGWDNSASDSAGAVRYVSPNALPAGGRVDMIARLLGQKLSAAMGHPL